MGLRGMLFQQMLLGLIILAATAASQPNSSCKEDRCGSLNSIPYPFGTRAGCYLDDSFLIQCVNISGTLKPFLGNDENLEVLNISIFGFWPIIAHPGDPIDLHPVLSLVKKVTLLL
ncbi:putative wall-associated receptor kinase-like 16 [Fagus crenata]